jgi:hypothetical protein
VLVEMHGTPDKTTGVKMRNGLTTAQQRLELHFASNAPVDLLTGSVVRRMECRLEVIWLLLPGAQAPQAAIA